LSDAVAAPPNTRKAVFQAALDRILLWVRLNSHQSRLDDMGMRRILSCGAVSARKGEIQIIGQFPPESL